MSFLFGMLIIHECAHLLTARYFHYPLSKVILYPFGIGAQIEHMGWGSVWKELMILAAGPCTHLIFPFFFYQLMKYHVISYSFMEYLCHINYSILIFNLFPIWPLDGGRIMQSLLHLFFPFQRAQIITWILSLIHLFFIIRFVLIINLSSIIVLLFLSFQILAAYRERRLQTYQFYYYRMMHPVNYRILAHHHQDIYRQRYNLIALDNGGWCEEEEWLKQKVLYVPQMKKKTFIML